MSGQPYDLTNLESNFKQLQADKKKAGMKTLEFILELNKNVKIDDILIRESYSNYTNKAALEKVEKNKTFKLYEEFFKYTVDSLDNIEEKYLKQSNDKQQIEQTSKQNQSEYNFLLNKNNISKFIRDQATHYQNTIEKYLEQTGDQGQKGIKTKKMHSFFIELFNNQFTTIVKDHVSLLSQPEEQIAVHIGNNLISYAKQTKQMSQEQAQGQFSINQEQILDFLTFWLKQESENSLFILYARTSSRLEQESKILMNKSNLRVKTHPSRMTKQEIKVMEKEQEQAGDIMSEQPVEKSQILEESQKEQVKQEEQPTTSKISFPKQYSALSLLRSKQFEPVTENQTIPQPPRELTKEQKLQKQIKNLFKFGCKRRYKINKNNTFDELQYELTNMNLEKFINFCNFFEIPNIIARDLLIEYFKLFALNQRTIDFSRFEQIMMKLVKTDERVIDHLLEKSKFEVKTKRNQIKNNKKVEGKLSDYKFKLRPVNGKDISTIQKQLTFRKLQKQIDREEKDQKALIKRERLERTKSNMKNGSTMGVSRLDVSRFQTVQEPTFNPERILSFDKDNDDLWNAYQAKIWKKEPKQTHNTLEQILSKRINKGTNIINKINSERSLLYE